MASGELVSRGGGGGGGGGGLGLSKEMIKSINVAKNIFKTLKDIQ